MSDKIEPRIEGDGSAWCDENCPRYGYGRGCSDVSHGDYCNPYAREQWGELEEENARLKAEVERLTAERAESRKRLRATAQILISEIGACGPVNAESAAAEAVQLIKNLRVEVARLRAEKENKYRPFTAAQIDVLRLMGVHVKPRVNTDGTPSQAVFNNRANEAEKQLKELRERARAALAKEEK